MKPFIVIHPTAAQRLRELPACPSDIRAGLKKKIGREKVSFQRGLTQAGKHREGRWRGVCIRSEDVRLLLRVVPKNLRTLLERKLRVDWGKRSSCTTRLTDPVERHIHGTLSKYRSMNNVKPTLPVERVFCYMSLNPPRDLALHETCAYAKHRDRVYLMNELEPQQWGDLGIDPEGTRRCAECGGFLSEAAL